jgi:hypothetical protein
MGFEVNSLNFLQYTLHVSRQAKFSNIATMGRQSINLLPKSCTESLRLLEGGGYCEDLLFKNFGATKVDSFDNSNYEDATFVADMNKPISENQLQEVKGHYDLVIDFGTLEHIYNVPQALWNMSAILKPGGEIVHSLPANGWIGHGFYQFSPELFYTVYSEINGYTDTEVFLVNCNNNRYFYKVEKPINGGRSCAEGDGEAYIMVKTVRARDTFSHDKIQQSDFVSKWNDSTPQNTQIKSPFRKWVKTIPFATNVYSKLISFRRKILFSTDKINSRNPCLTKLAVSELLTKSK